VKFFTVYRTYVKTDSTDKTSRNYIDWAISNAKKASSPINARIYDFIRDVLTLDILSFNNDGIINRDDQDNFINAVQQFTLKFQQYTGPVMAKSIEDTFFYRYNRFVCLNEVGGEPEKFGSTIAAFHVQNQQRQANRPLEMTSTSTHDTKRSEDIRARLAVLSEIPKVWESKVFYWQTLNQSLKTQQEENFYPTANDEYFIYQNLVGILPPSWASQEIPNEDEVENVKNRLKEYAIKGIREAKNYTSWIDQNEDYEKFVINFIDKILQPSNHNEFFRDVLNFHKSLNDYGLLNSLIQTILKLTCPGIPDIYQGCEIWNYSLVDPDNRRAIDYKKLQSVLLSIKGTSKDNLKQLIDERLTGVIKIYVTQICLHSRQSYSDLFIKGSYLPVEVSGPAKDHIIAFARKSTDKTCLVILPIKFAKLMQKIDIPTFTGNNILEDLVCENLWRDTFILLPENLQSNNFKNIFTQTSIRVENNQLNCKDAFKHSPFCVLID
jgi:(1->4)-alpha-D-glucan 1-alpha-D-glucosylmutase